MAECNWDPSKHGGKPCPVHGTGGGKVTEKDGKFYREMEDGTVRMAANEKDLYEEPATPEQLKSEFNDLLKEGLSEQEAVDEMLFKYDIPDEEITELFGVEYDGFDSDNDFENWDEETDSERKERLQHIVSSWIVDQPGYDKLSDEEIDQFEKEVIDVLAREEKEYGESYENAVHANIGDLIDGSTIGNVHDIGYKLLGLSDDDFDNDYDEEFDPIQEMEDDGVDLTDRQEVLEYLGATLGLDREDQMIVLERLGFDDDEDEFDDDYDNDYDDDFEYEPDDDDVSVDDRELIEDKVRQQIKQNKVKSIGELRQILQSDTKINQLSNGELNAMVRRIKRGR